MSHVDDGKLNALLDGELEPAEASAVQAHIVGCAECAKRLEEAKHFLAEAADLLGTLEPPQPAALPQQQVRRVSKTAKEVALDVDGATRQSPAMMPNLPGEVLPPAPGAAPARHRFDFTTLAWAATIVLAIGIGYLANEVKNARQTIAFGEGATARQALRAPGPAATEAPSRAAKAHRSAHGGEEAAATGRAPANIPAQAAPPTAPAGRAVATANVARKPAPESRGKQLAAAAAPAEVGGIRTDEPLSAFRRATLEEAVARLQGSIRLIDGMRAAQVEVGPGRLVPGADRGRDLVRVIYVDEGGRRLQLDQQRIGAASPSDTLAALRELRSPTDVGLAYGDTLMTAAADGQLRVRWIDRGNFWLSLSGSLPPDSLRRLVGRVR